MQARKMKAVVEYNGSRYSGFQRQKNVPTIEGELLGALERLVGYPVDIQGASRTDAGVHALGQVIHFHLLSPIPTASLVQALNGLLPPDIVIQEVEEVGEDFAAQFSARGKHYFYQILNRSLPSAFQGPFTLHVYQHLHVDLMKQGGEMLVGRRDFSSFEAQGSNPRDPHCHIWQVQVERVGDLVIIHVLGDRFLYKMVRIIVGTLLLVGRKKIAVPSLPMILKARDRRLAGPTVDAAGLFLKKVFY